MLFKAEREIKMLDKICLAISVLMSIFCYYMLVAFAYLTRVGFYNGKEGLLLIALSILSAALFTIAAVMFEKRIESKQK